MLAIFLQSCSIVIEKIDEPARIGLNFSKVFITFVF